MNNKMLLWKVSLSKGNKKKVFKELYFLGEYLLQVSHSATYLIYGDGEDDGGMFDFDVNIIGIERVKEIDDIVNAHNFDEDSDEGMEIDSDFPYKIIENDKNFPENLKIEFKHSCGNVQHIGLFNWRILECRDCHKLVRRDQIEEVGGLYLFVENK